MTIYKGLTRAGKALTEPLRGSTAPGAIGVSGNH